MKLASDGVPNFLPSAPVNLSEIVESVAKSCWVPSNKRAQQQNDVGHHFMALKSAFGRRSRIPNPVKNHLIFPNACTEASICRGSYNGPELRQKKEIGETGDETQGNVVRSILVREHACVPRQTPIMMPTISISSNIVHCFSFMGTLAGLLHENIDTTTKCRRDNKPLSK